MNNAELIKALRICANQTCCDNCPRYDIDHTQDAQRCCIQLINDAADALEAAEKRIAELEKQLPKEAHWVAVDNGHGVCSNCNRQDSIDNMATHCRYCGAKMKTVTDCHALEESKR